jgi:hypothetical protein
VVGCGGVVGVWRLRLRWEEEKRRRKSIRSALHAPCHKIKIQDDNSFVENLKSKRKRR